MEPGNGEEMERSRLLKWLFNVIARLMAQPKCSAANQTHHFGRILDIAAEHVLHPFARSSSGTQDRECSACRKNSAILRIANDKQVFHVASHEIFAHVEFSRISRWLDHLQSAEQVQFVTHVWPPVPVNKSRSVCPETLTVNFDVVQFQKESRVPIALDFWLGRDAPREGGGMRPLTGDLRKDVSRCVGDATAVKCKKCRAN